jgi:hypothetical protein
LASDDDALESGEAYQRDDGHDTAYNHDARPPVVKTLGSSRSICAAGRMLCILMVASICVLGTTIVVVVAVLPPGPALDARAQRALYTARQSVLLVPTASIDVQSVPSPSATSSVVATSAASIDVPVGEASAAVMARMVALRGVLQATDTEHSMDGDSRTDALRQLFPRWLSQSTADPLGVRGATGEAARPFHPTLEIGAVLGDLVGGVAELAHRHTSLSNRTMALEQKANTRRLAARPDVRHSSSSVHTHPPTRVPRSEEDARRNGTASERLGGEQR